MKMWTGGTPVADAPTKAAKVKAKAKPAAKPAAGAKGRPGGGGGSRTPLWLRIVGWCTVAGLLLTAIGACAIALTFWMYARDLDHDAKLAHLDSLADYHPKQVTKILDANDRRIGEIFGSEGRRTVISYAELTKKSPIVVDAFVAAEDNRFWTHDGIDYTGMVRAFVANLRSGHAKEGASTITQQVVKNFLLTPEKTFKRKIQEIILARRLEHALSKEDIMTLYLNQIYFGANRYGVEEAALYYFGKHASDLDAGEASMLAAMPKEPEVLAHALEDKKNPEKAKDRQIYVLNQLVELGKLSRADAQKFIDAPIHVVEHPFPELGSAPEWVDLAKDQLVKQLIAADTEDGSAEDKTKRADERLETMGAQVRTTLDPGLQAMAQKALQQGLRNIDKKHGAGRSIKELKGDKPQLEIAKLAKQLPAGGPAAKDVYDAVVTAVRDDGLDVDLGHWEATLALTGDDEARYNPPDADGKTKSASDRFKVGSVVEVMTMPDASGKHVVRFAPGPEGAVVIIEVKTRKVRAIVGGYSSKIGDFDRATRAHRQPGSTFKPIIYGAAIERTMKDIADPQWAANPDNRADMFTAGRVMNDAPQVSLKWRPKNFEGDGFVGPIRLRVALAKSLNEISFQILEKLQPQGVIEFARRMGIKDAPLPPNESIGLGADEVAPIEMVNTIATLAAGGTYAPPRFVDAIDGRELAQTGVVENAIDPKVAFVVLDMMRSVIEEGTGAAALSLKIPVVGKTGTSNGPKDCWFIGLTPDYAIGVWTGYDDSRILRGEQGATTALPIWIDIVKQMKLPAKTFKRPDGLVDVTIDKATGLLAPDDAAKGTTMTELYIKGTEPTETASGSGDTTDENLSEKAYGD
jgi:penicillin-binding protein 1A|nr:transglycosylase domain-containing protein [Kofleriaceae bacterium]